MLRIRLIVVSGLIFTGLSSPLWASNKLLSGSDVPQKKGNCYSYKNYVVAVVSHQESVGETIYVGKRSSKSMTADCQRAKSLPLLKVEQDASYFMGMANNLLLVDNGTSNARQFSIIDVNNGKRRFFTDYYSEIKTDSRRNLIFEVPIGQVKTLKECPPSDQTAANQALMPQIQLLKTVLFNLFTQKATETNKLSCGYFE